MVLSALSITGLNYCLRDHQEDFPKGLGIQRLLQGLE